MERLVSNSFRDVVPKILGVDKVVRIRVRKDTANCQPCEKILRLCYGRLRGLLVLLSSVARRSYSCTWNSYEPLGFSA